MTSHKQNQVLRPSFGVMAIVVAPALLFLIGFAFLYRLEGWNWKTLSFAGLSLMGLGGILEAFITRIELGDDALRIVSLFSRKNYPRSQIEQVKPEWKSGVFLKLASGGWVEIPWMLSGKEHLTAIRAWLKRTT